MVEQTADQERVWWTNIARSAATTKENITGEWDPAGKNCAKAIMTMAPKALKNYPRMLEVGCGNGRVTSQIAKLFPETEITGIDISESMLKRARARARKLKINNATYILGDGRSIPVKEKFDLVWSILCFQHLPKESVSGYIQQIYDCLNPDGAFIFQHVLGTEQSFLSHQVKESELLDWTKQAGFKVIKHRLNMLMPQWIWIIAQKAGR